MWKSSSNKGFTLLEVMLAVTILSVGLVMVVRSYATSLRAIKTSQDFLIANLLLEQKIWEKQEQQARLGVIIPEAEEGEFDSSYDKFSYDISFEEQEDSPLLTKINYELSWQQRKSKWSISCISFLRSEEE